MAISDERLTEIEVRAKLPTTNDIDRVASLIIIDLVAELRRVRAVVRGITAEMRSRAEGIGALLDHDAITNRQGADELMAIVDVSMGRLRAAVTP